MMAALAATVRVSLPNGAAWRTCETCGRLAALAPDAEHCRPRRKTRRVAR